MPLELFNSVAKKTVEHEYYTPIPEGYKKGKTKYIIITGSVMSGLGKGIFSASLGKILQEKGYNCSPIKFDGYLNVDAGTLNPYRHGEVFVLDDGTECDMDLGTYERFLDKNLTNDNYLTGGKIFNKVLSMEREGRYLGRDVQFIPHVTGEIKLFLRKLSKKKKSDIVLIEVGGTVGDIENQYFIEAMRQLAYEEGKDNSCFVNVTYILEPDFLGEQKSKAAQLGIRRLMELGIQPNIIACRATKPVTEKVREKISIYSNVPFENVISIHDVKSIYLIPSLLKKSEIDKRVLEILNLRNRSAYDKKWNNFVNRINNLKDEITIGITGKYVMVRDSYASIIKALEHAGIYLNTKLNIKWIDTEIINDNNAATELKDIKGIIVPGGFGKRGTEGKISCIKYARENNLPYLGLCFGFQMALIEYARNILKLKNANSTEIDPKTKYPVVDILPEQKLLETLGGNMRLGGHDILIKENTLAYNLYKQLKIRERFRHRYECNPDYIDKFEEKGIVFSGKSADEKNIMQILELTNHKFFIGTQYHGEYTSRPLKPHPLYLGFIKACLSA